MKCGVRQIEYGASIRIGTIASSIAVLAMAAIILMWDSLSAAGADADSEPNQGAKASADTPYKNARILFTSDRDGDWEIYVVRADGTGLKKLTDNSFDDGASGWSPDGKRIAYVSRQRDGNIDIYVMNADGSDRRLLTDDPARDCEPCWSPLVAFGNVAGR